MNFLERIIADKRTEVARAKAIRPLRDLEHSALFNVPRPSMREALAQPGPSIIAEFKRKSPSKGDINRDASPQMVVPGYRRAGAAAVSVLTDAYFNGSLQDLSDAFGCTDIPLLRKDFIIDEYQLVEARSAGASAILLIAAALGSTELRDLAAMASSLELDVLFEVHCEEELEKCPQNISIIGVNNRNLETFAVDVATSLELAGKIPGGISESFRERDQ